MNRLADLILTYPKSILGAFFLLALLAIYPALRIQTDFNLENFFPENDPSINDYKMLEREFGRDDNVIMVGFQTDTLLSVRVLHDLKSITDSVQTIPNVTEVRSLWSAEQIKSDENRLSFAPYLSEADLTNLQSASLAKEWLADPFISGFLINEQADVTAFYLEISEDRNNYAVRDSVISRLQQVLEPYAGRYDFKISGIPYYRNQYVQFLNNEIAFYIMLSSVLVVLLLWILYRSFSGIAVPMVIVWLTILFTLAVMHLSGGYFEVMTSTIAPILLCVGIADSIHMISKYDDLRLQGIGKSSSIREMLLTLGSATFLTSITTAIGFGTLVTSDIVPMQRFGTYAAVGVMIAYFVTILLLPGMLAALNIPRVFKDKSAGIFTLFSKLLIGISQLNRKYYKQITIGFILISLGIGLGISRLQINGKVFDELGEQTQPIQDARFFSENLSPPFPMEFIIDTGKENGIIQPDFLRRLDRFTHHLSSYEEVIRVTSFNTLMKEVHSAMAPDSAAAGPLPASEPLLAQYLLLLEVSDTDFLERAADFSYRKVRVAAQVQDVGSHRINQIRASLNRYLNSHFPDSKVTVTGSTILSADLNEKIVKALLQSIVLAFLLISAIMGFLFRNARIVLISLIPNVLPLIMVAGIMGFAGIDIKSSTAVIFTIAFGIAVDDSIHYLARLRVEMKRGYRLRQALRMATLKTGKAIFVTSLILLAGFGTLLTSVFSSTVYMGLLVGLTVVFALLADLFLLPSLMYWNYPELSFKANEAQRDPTPVDGVHPEEA